MAGMILQYVAYAIQVKLLDPLENGIDCFLSIYFNDIGSDPEGRSNEAPEQWKH